MIFNFGNSLSPKTKMVFWVLLWAVLVGGLAIAESPADATPAAKRPSLFNPVSNKKLLIVGQDMVALGGLREGTKVYADGYLDDPELAALAVGLTTYLQISDNRGLNATFHNEGEMKNAELTATHPAFAPGKPILCIGYFLNNDYAGVLAGKYDSNLKTLSDWITKKNLPVFLRIGYEFNADWTGHPANKSGYMQVFRYIVDRFRAWGSRNCAFVWQSDGQWTATQLASMYPGDDYVDWMAYSHFTNHGHGLIELAKLHGKPVMIAESSPIDFKLGALGDADGKAAWDAWFAPLFRAIAAEPQIKALAYINDDWPQKAMWRNVAYFNKSDSRIQKSPYVRQHWIQEMRSGAWFSRSEALEAIGWIKD